MEWKKLLSEKRERPSATRGYSDDFRNEFDKDYDRMISFSSVRRLQDKTQVFPLQTNDYTRTRLTHSLEVSALGRSLGTHVANRLINDKGIKNENLNLLSKIPSLLSVACLVHDLGNPPFGHYGEFSIRNWFRTWFKSPEFSQVEGALELSAEQKNDFINFDGNPQTFRILAKLQFLNDHLGANFTYGTLATLIKYPLSSSEGKKFGYFQSEHALFTKIRNETGITKGKHPLTLLLEAADDIANSAADIEDAVKKRVIPWKTVYLGLHSDFSSKYPKLFSYVERMSNKISEENTESKEGIELEINSAQNFRIMVQGEMIKACINAFMEHYTDIMNGNFNESLIEVSTAKEIYMKLKALAEEYIYVCDEVLKLELVGNKVIEGLLDLFVKALVDEDNKHYSYRFTSGKLYKLISPNFRHVIRYDANGNIRPRTELSLYHKLQLAVDFVSGMSDTYALQLYQELTGVKL